MSELKSQLPEAPASVTYNVVSKDGFSALVTHRSDTIKELLEHMETIEQKLLEKGYKPQVRGGGFKREVEFVEGRICPKCNGKLIKKTSKAGKMFYKCENGKYDFVAQKNTGCDYVDWLQDA